MRPRSAEKALKEGLALFQQNLITENDYDGLKQIVLKNLAEKIEKEFEIEGEDSDSGVTDINIQFPSRKKGPGRPKNSLNKSTIKRMNAPDAVTVQETPAHVSNSTHSVTIEQTDAVKKEAKATTSATTDAVKKEATATTSETTDAVEMEATATTDADEMEDRVNPNYFVSATGIEFLDKNHFLMQSPDMSIFEKKRSYTYYQNMEH